jgi:hypothetical protein
MQSTAISQARFKFFAFAVNQFHLALALGTSVEELAEMAVSFQSWQRLHLVYSCISQWPLRASARSLATAYQIERDRFAFEI